MEIIEDKSDKFIVRLDVSDSLANAIRRSVSEIKTLAVDEVEIYKNDSALYDEILAHRLGLIPLKTEKSMNDKTKIELKLTKKGPCTVYASDIEGDAEVLYPKIPITMLGEGHKLELVATASLGKGLDHAKHIPGLCFYRNVTEVKSSPEIDKIVLGAKGLIKPEKKGSKWICDLPEVEADEVEKIEKGAVSYTQELIFVIESWGMISAKEIFLKAISALEENLDEFEKALK